MKGNLIHLLQQRVEQTPEAIALLDARRTRSRQAPPLTKGGRGDFRSRVQGGDFTAYSFADLQIASQRLAGYFMHHCQLKPGDGVLLLQPLSAELYIALAAIWQVGAIAVILNPLLGQRYVAHCAREINLRVWLAPSLLFTTQLLSPALRRIPHKIAVGASVPGVTSWPKVQRHAPEPHSATLKAGAPALLSFTSGTTGPPKPIARSHSLLLAQYHALAPVLEWQPGAKELTTLPLFGLANLVAGGTTVIPPVNVRRPVRVSGAKLRGAIAQHQIDRIVAAPGILGRLLQGADHPLPSLRQVFIGGAPVTKKLCDRLQSLAPNTRITIVYGATEAEPIAVIPPAPLPCEKPQKLHPNTSQPLAASPPLIRGEGGIAGLSLGNKPSVQPTSFPLGLCVGKPVDALELRIFNSESHQSTPPGQPGEIIVRGPHVLQSPQSHHHLIHQGQRWHRTGDLGYLDAQGQLWLLGRATAAIRDDRGTLYPLAVEAMANELPGVARSALVQWRGRRLLLVEWEQRPWQIFATKLAVWVANTLNPPRSALRLTTPPKRGFFKLNLLLGGVPEGGGGSVTPNSQFRTLFAWAQLDHIVPLRTIPTDRRHNAKVNYPQLQHWLRSPWGRASLWFMTRTGDRG